MLTDLATFDAASGKTYLQALVACAHADGRLEEVERLFIIQRAMVLGLDARSLMDTPEGHMETLDARHLTQHQRLVIVRDCFLLINADHVQTYEEFGAVFTVANHLDVPAHHVSKLESWLVNHIISLRKGQALIKQLS